MVAALPVVATQRWDGLPVARDLLERTRARVERVRRAGAPLPTIASVAVGEGGPFHVYQRQQARTAEKAGVTFQGHLLPEDVPAHRIESLLGELDRDPAVSGVLLQHPLPSSLNFERLIAVLRPEKDVDGVSDLSLGRLAGQHPGHIPAVTLAVRSILKHYGVVPSAERTVIIGRSATVGIPLALLLLLRGPEGDATVTVAHSRTPRLDEVTRSATLLVPCVGRPGLLHRGNVSHGAAIVDVGLSTGPVDEKGRPAVLGDADLAALEGWARAISPVPGGVGPVTVAHLMENTVNAWSRQLGLEARE